MRFALRACLLVCLMPLLALAQPTTQPADGPGPGRGRGGPGGPGGGGGARILERIQQVIDEDLQLSDSQKDKIHSILEDTRGEMRELLPQLRDMEPPQRREKIEGLLKDLREKISNELDDNQKKIFAEKVQNLQELMGRGRGGMGGGQALERLQQIAKDLDLTDDQKKQMETLFAETRKQLQDIRAKVQNGANQQEVQEEARQVMQDVREKLSGILTPEQQQKLREAMQQQGGPGGPPGNERRNRDGADRNPNDQPKNNDAPPADKPKETPPGKVEANPPPDTPQTAQAGTAAPDFTLQKLDGKPVQLSSFKNRTLVLIFGCATSPSFREKAKGLEELSKDFASRVSFLVVYTREAHAKDQWEVDRNKDAKVDIVQPSNISERMNLAKQLRQGLGMTIPFGVDTMEDDTLKAYAAAENAAFIIDKDGKIAYRQNWCDPYRLRPQLEQITRTTK